MWIVAATRVRAKSVTAEVVNAGENSFVTLNVKPLKRQGSYNWANVTRSYQMTSSDHAANFLTSPETLQICNKKACIA